MSEFNIFDNNNEFTPRAIAKSFRPYNMIISIENVIKKRLFTDTPREMKTRHVIHEGGIVFKGDIFPTDLNGEYFWGYKVNLKKEYINALLKTLKLITINQLKNLKIIYENTLFYIERYKINEKFFNENYFYFHYAYLYSLSMKKDNTLFILGSYSIVG
jgi:hypothetical protein